jgi:CHASE2 domain-containing sensor protein
MMLRSARIPHRLQTMLVAGVLAALVAGGAFLSGGLDSLELKSVDGRFSLRPTAKPTEIVVVAIDDVSFSELRLQWPFPRKKHARVADQLRKAGAGQIVFDIQFTEATEAGQDLALFEALGRAGGAVLATSESNDLGETRVLGGEENLREIGAIAASSTLPDEDEGVIRRLLHDNDGLHSLGVAVAERAGRKVPRERFGADGTAWIDFRGGPRTFPTVSFSDVLKGRVDPMVFKDKIVVGGPSAPTLQDVHPVPTSDSLMSGPEIQANAIWTALHGLPLRDAPLALNLAAILLLSMLIPLVALLRGPLLAGLVAPVIGFAYAVGAQLAFDGGLIVAVVGPLLGLVVATVTSTTASFALENRERRRIARDNEVLEEAVRERTAELHATQLEIIQRLGQAVDSRDEETGEHIGRITDLSRALAAAAGLGRDRAEMLSRASAMHDVGKVAIPDAILSKPGPLSTEERAIMQTHARRGAEILAGSRSPLIQLAEEIALTHHERWDGTGYPTGMAGESIPLSGRIVAVCDVYDALVSRRPYKEPWTPAEALSEIRKQAGRHFDPRLAELFLDLMADVAAAEPDDAAWAEPAAAAA